MKRLSCFLNGSGIFGTDKKQKDILSAFLHVLSGEKEMEKQIQKVNNYGIASLVMGILGVALVGVLWAILGLCFAHASNKAAVCTDTPKSGFAKAGKILSIISIFLCIICYTAFAVLLCMVYMIG